LYHPDGEPLQAPRFLWSNRFVSTAGIFRMTLLAIRGRVLTAALVVRVVLHAESQAQQAAPKQDGSTPSASSATRDASVEQATRLMQQGKNDEALRLLENIAAAEPARRGIVRAIGIAYYT